MNNCGWGFTPHPKRILFRSLLINGMCDFEDGTRAARRRVIARTTLRWKQQTKFIAWRRTCSRNLYRAENLRYQNKTDKNSRRNFARLSAWCCALCAQAEKFERRYGRDALNNTSCECVVAKANEADCLANAEVQTREEGGNFI